MNRPIVSVCRLYRLHMELVLLLCLANFSILGWNLCVWCLGSCPSKLYFSGSMMILTARDVKKMAGILSDLTKKWQKFCQIWQKNGRILSDLTKKWQNFVRSDKKMAEFCQIWQKNGRIFVRNGVLVYINLSESVQDFVRFWPDFLGNFNPGQLYLFNSLLNFEHFAYQLCFSGMNKMLQRALLRREKS